MATVTKIAPSAQPHAGTIHWLNECIERSKNGVFSEVTTLTPGLAGELLRRNEGNRGVRAAKAQQYANDIRSGKWVFNGEPIIISDTGELNDGQHRANAVVEANVSIPTVLLFGLPRETRLTIDQGAARTAGDYLAMEHVPNATVQASLARSLIAFDRSGGTHLNEARHVTNAEVMERVHADTKIAESAHFAAINSKVARPFAPPQVISFCHYVFSEISPVEADEYMGQVCRGEGLRQRDPAYTVRDRLNNLGTKSREQRIHIIVRGWNAFRQGRKLDIAKITGNENIPAAI